MIRSQFACRASRGLPPPHLDGSLHSLSSQKFLDTGNKVCLVSGRPLRRKAPPTPAVARIRLPIVLNAVSVPRLKLELVKNLEQAIVGSKRRGCMVAPSLLIEP